MLTALRHPASAGQQRRLLGPGQPLTDSVFETVNSNVLGVGASAFAVCIAITTAFSHVGASFPMWVRVFQLALPRQDEILSPQETWVRVFQLALPRQDEISSPQETWVRVFPCGCEFFNLHFPDKMEILSPQEIPASDPQLVPSRKYPTDSAEEAFSEGSFSQWEKGIKTTKAEVVASEKVLRVLFPVENLRFLRVLRRWHRQGRF